MTGSLWAIWVMAVILYLMIVVLGAMRRSHRRDMDQRRILRGKRRDSRL
ncbi:MAG: hypothetical protein WBP10_03670 [Thermoanaerobaculia bacterium]